MKTRFTELMGIDIPIQQGGMYYVGYAELAAAVSNAGGLGTVTSSHLKTPEALRAEIRKCKALTKKPFAVNLTLLPTLLPPNYMQLAEVIVEEGVKIVETAGRNPAEFITFFKKHNVKVIHKCTSVRHALTAERLGADCVSLDGFEAGGHPGEDDVTNWTLYPKASQVLKIPFIASGACTTGKHLAAAFALGCEGMLMGTRFMATVEAPVKQSVKDALVRATELDTTIVMRSLKNTERVYKNAFSAKVQELEKTNPGDIKAIYPYVQGDHYRKVFQETGDVQSAVFSCGQGVGTIDDIPTCAQLLQRIVREAEDVVNNRLARLVSKL
jgi:NAD(P)H-dependent flavin oxidoreductase YrpB (nitropropane dioxygenase family)